MAYDEGTWIMYGLDPSDPDCIQTAEELIDYVEKVGFLPLFRNEIPGFSAEEHAAADYWWTGDELRDPWEWRKVLARSDRVIYGKFFGGRAGFIAREWFPAFANVRRDGYDFDALWDDELASAREKKIMDLFPEETELFSFEVKRAAGFGKGGEKNFEGTVTRLQMEGYLCICDFRQRVNKRGEAYGWDIAVYARPERKWGYAWCCSAYGEAPRVSAERILGKLRSCWGDADERSLLRVIGGRA